MSIPGYSVTSPPEAEEANKVQRFTRPEMLGLYGTSTCRSPAPANKRKRPNLFHMYEYYQRRRESVGTRKASFALGLFAKAKRGKARKTWQGTARDGVTTKNKQSRQHSWGRNVIGSSSASSHPCHVRITGPPKKRYGHIIYPLYEISGICVFCHFVLQGPQYRNGESFGVAYRSGLATILECSCEAQPRAFPHPARL